MTSPFVKKAHKGARKFLSRLNITLPTSRPIRGFNPTGDSSFSRVTSTISLGFFNFTAFESTRLWYFCFAYNAEWWDALLHCVSLLADGQKSYWNPSGGVSDDEGPGLIRERTIFKQLVRADVQYVNEKTGRKTKGTRVSPCLITIDFGLRVVVPHLLLPPFSVKRLTTTRRSRYTGLQRVRGWLASPRESSTGDK